MQKEARGKKCSLHRANFITLASSFSSCTLLLPFSSERGPSSLILRRLLSSFALPTSPHRFTLRYVHCVRLLLRSVISSLLLLLCLLFFSSTFAPCRSLTRCAPFRFASVLPLPDSLSSSSNIPSRFFASLTGCFPSARPSFKLILPPNFALHCDPQGGYVRSIAVRLILITDAEE